MVVADVVSWLLLVLYPGCCWCCILVAADVVSWLWHAVYLVCVQAELVAWMKKMNEDFAETEKHELAIVHDKR